MSAADQSESARVQGWAGTDSSLAGVVRQQSEDCLLVYRSDPKRVDEDLATEIGTAEGGYGRKQIYELVQNGADALLSEPGRIEITLTDNALYVANEGAAFTSKGIHALMAARLSDKRSEEIGRFGLGFKSVVSISHAPQVFSRSVSLAFDREWAASRIDEVVAGRSHYPILRLAYPLDPKEHASADPLLAALMRWASTVIRLPLRHENDAVRLLGEDLRDFPAEFLLFSPHVRELRLADDTTGLRRQITLTSQQEGRLELSDGGDLSTWRVLSTSHRPSAAAAKDAGELAHREAVTVKWAVPYQKRNRLGEFWAFFPTQARTTLSGIINAPWKLSDDRRTLIEGRFNEELLTSVLPSLILREFGNLADAEDPCAVLDLLPARGREVRSWADDVINAPVFERLSEGRSLPDIRGKFSRPRDVILHPKGLAEPLLAEWSELLHDPHRWAHPGVDRTPERRLKAERLLAGRGRVATIPEWTEALCQRPTIDGSAAAISILSRLLHEHPDMGHEARRSRVLLLEDDRLVAPLPGTVFVRSSPDESGFDFIHNQLVGIAGVRGNLESLGIRVLDRGGELRNALSRPGTISWQRVWELSRAVPLATAEEIIQESLPTPLTTSVHVRTAAGRWVPLGEAFLGGPVVPLDGSRDAQILIDPRFHSADEELITRVGGVSKPVARSTAPDERWLVSYRDQLIDDFTDKATGSKPARDKLIVEGPRPPWPLDYLDRASDQTRVALTEAVLRLDSGSPWAVRHRTNANYGKRTYKAPATWWLRRHGRLETSFGPWPVQQAIAPGHDWPEDVLPVADVTEQVAERMSLVAEPSDLAAESWQRMLAIAAGWSDEERRYRLYAWAAHFVEAPARLQIGPTVRGQTLEPSKVAASSSPDEYRGLREQRIPAILVDDPNEKTALIESWGLADGSRMLQQELVVERLGEPQPLVDQFPGLRVYLETGQSSLEIQPCRSLALLTATPGGQVSRSVPGLLRGDQVLVTADEPRDLLQQISNALSLELSGNDIDGILRRQQQDQARALAAQIRRAESDAERLALAVGAQELRRAIPRPAVEALEQERRRTLSETELAEMAMAVHGLAVVQHFKDVLERRGLNPPQQWAGRSTARKFVAGLGFPTDYAGFPGDRRAAVFEVDGPAVLPPLHDYQEYVTNRVKNLVRGNGPSRGMLSLPTGAGKTRVCVQALVEEVRAGHLQDGVVWIAQSDELCEQAVQTWAYVWRALGPNERLVISRFWDYNNAVEEPEAFQLVVATPDKLMNAVGKSEYEWLTDAPIVVVDEAHSSVAAQYTRVLEWLGRGRSRKERRPLIGLTATPFRNVNVQETRRLASRYEHFRLDEGAIDGDPYAALQARGVLARVQQEILQGVDVPLTGQDLQAMKWLYHLPSAVESRLGSNIERNRRIVESVATLPEEWTILLFATSVENARALAAQLSFRGVPSVAISSQTEPAARRRYVEQFEDGVLRVITNYNVLTQGFDAPAVRAVYVTRPTFSANLYQQMVGRGLRGPLNGGSDEVLIVNVRDNIEAFGDRLAFYHFEHLWASNGQA